MDPEITNRLLDINYQFYQTFADQFSATRERLQPGVRKVLDGLQGDERILDIGCGNGNIWQELVRRGHRGCYIGLDFSSGLLERARARALTGKSNVLGANAPLFILTDLSKEDWERSLPSGEYDLVFVFAVLHHLPGSTMRINFLNRVHGLLAQHARLVISVWQFMNSARLRKRVKDWSLVGIEAKHVDPGDYLLDWRQGGSGLRYVHLFDQTELERLAKASRFYIVETFFSDGREGDLGCYQVWEALKE